MMDDKHSREEWLRGWAKAGRRERRFQRHMKVNKSTSVVAGLILLAVGGVLISRNLGVDMPDWLFKCPMIPIVFGLFIGLTQGFRDMGWLIICGAGFFFLVDDIW